MSIKKVFIIWVVVLVALSSFVALSAGSQIEDKLSRVISRKLGLNSGIYRVIETEYQGDRLILVAIFGVDSAQNSSLGQDIKKGLRNNREKNPVAISILSRNQDVKFHPYALRVIQNGESGRVNKVIGLTEGFKNGALPERVPIEGKVFWGSKGIITLGESFDPTTPFEIKYGTTSASFSLSQRREPVRQEVSGEKEQEQVTGFKEEGSESQGQGLKPSEPSSEPSGETPNNPPSQRRPRSGAGQGFALLAQFGTLLALTLSLL